MENNVNMDVLEMKVKYSDWVQMVQDRIKQHSFVSTVLQLQIN
jgi:hypothetical protein